MLPDKAPLFTETDWRLLLVSKATLIGRLPLHGDKVYCVDKVILLPLSQAPLPEELKLQEVMKYCGRVMLCYLYHLYRVMNKRNELKLVYVCVCACVCVI